MNNKIVINNENAIQPKVAGKVYKRKSRDTMFAICLVAPAAVMLCATIFLPLLEVIRMSFFRVSILNLKDIRWNSFDNYRRLFNDSELLPTFLRTITYVFSTVILLFILGLAVALLLNSNIKGRNIFRGLIFLPWTVPTVVVAVVFMWMYQPQYGILNYILIQLHLIDHNISWLGDMKTALPAIIVAAIWRQMPLMMVMFLAALQTVPKELEEAATIDGANHIQKFVNVTIPCIMSVVKTVTLTSIITNFQMLGLFQTMTGGGPVRATTTLTIYTYETAFMSYNIGKGSAIGVMWLCFLVIFSILYNKFFSKMDAYAA